MTQYNDAVLDDDRTHCRLACPAVYIDGASWVWLGATHCCPPTGRPSALHRLVHRHGQGPYRGSGGVAATGSSCAARRQSGPAGRAGFIEATAVLSGRSACSSETRPRSRAGDAAVAQRFPGRRCSRSARAGLWAPTNAWIRSPARQQVKNDLDEVLCP